jgi:hypothetical protein
MMDELENFKISYLSKKPTINFCVPFSNPLMFIDGISGLTLYRENNFQVQLFICEPNINIPEHTHPNIDSFELFLYGMKFTHSGKTIIDSDMALKEKNKIPFCSYQTIRVKPNDWHGGVSSKNGGAFISIQHWLNDTKPTHVSDDWQGEVVGKKHKQQLNMQEAL